MKRLISLALALSLIVLLFAGCSKIPELPSYEEAENMEAETTTSAIKETKEMNLGITKTSISMGAAYLLDSIDNDTALGKYKYDFYDKASDMGEKLVSGDLSIGFMDVKSAVKLCNDNPGKVKIIAISSLNNAHFVEMTDSATNLDELKANGGKIYLGSSDSISTLALKFILDKKGITSSVTLNFQYDESTIKGLVEKDRVLHCVLSEPYISEALLETEDEVIGMDLGKLWTEACVGTDYEGSNICSGVIVANAKYLGENSVAIDDFLREYASSVKNVNSQKTAGDLLKEYGFISTTDIAKDVIARSNLTCLKNADMKETLTTFLSALGIEIDAEKSIYEN